MAKATRGKRTTNKRVLKSRAARGRKPHSAAAKAAFPGGSVKMRGEVKRVVPRMTRA